MTAKTRKQENMSTSVVTQTSSDVKNIDLADLGKRRIEWAHQSMPVLQIIRKDFIKNQPLKDIRISACLHVTTETANQARTLGSYYKHILSALHHTPPTPHDDGAHLVRTAATNR